MNSLHFSIHQSSGVVVDLPLTCSVRLFFYMFGSLWITSRFSSKKCPWHCSAFCSVLGLIFASFLSRHCEIIAAI